MKLAAISLLLTTLAFGADRQVVLTFDDLPRGGDGGGKTLDAIREMTQKLVQPFAARKLPFAGFVNEGRASEIGHDGLREILNLWLDAGATLGNHTYSHPDINRTPLAEYTANVLQGEPLLREVLAARRQELIYFRHPFLHTGATLADKQGLANFLRERKYVEAPVTFDDADYLFANAYTKPALRERVRREYIPYLESIVAYFERRSVEVFGREIPQILLLHANQLNADLMPALLDMFRSRGYRFVSLAEALRDEAHRTTETYVGKSGISWLHRWAHTKGLPDHSEPDPPAWVPNPYR